ncbi:Carbohydrate-binding-like fold [Hirschfeldia incana]|nr:Carbohydrate-binding-like fold [Hirschfeldia incana]
MIGGTLTSSPPSSSTKFILDDSPTWIFRRGGAGAEIFPCVVPRKTLFHLKFLRLDSSVVHSKILKPMIPLRASSSEEVNIGEDAETEAADPGRTVRVRFQLRKECVFGEHFFILGDHPAFGGGLWDPENALPLNWSDGHVWTLDLDLPVGRLVEFKFILKAETGEILWQPGPNRAVETWETNKTIRICEDWENADLQMMREEDFVPLLNQEEKLSSLTLDMPIVAENVTHPKQSVALVNDASSNGAVEEVQVLDAVENAGYVSDDEPEENSSGALTACQDENVIVFTEEESPVLVPGLFPLTDMENEEVSGPIAQVAAEVINEAVMQVDKKQETKGERTEKGKVKAVSVFDKSEQEAVNSVEKMHYNAAEEEMPQQQGLEIEELGTPNMLLEKDIQWGRRKIYKLLSNFGLF